MSTFSLDIDLTEIDLTERPAFELLPDGDYLLEVVSAEETVEGFNVKVNHGYSVVEPEDYKGRRVFDWLDLQNTEEWKAKQGLTKLGRVLASIGYDQATEGRITNHDVYFLRPFMAKVVRTPAGVSKAGKPFKASNKVEKVYLSTDKDAPEGPSIYENQPALPDSAPVAANNNTPQAAVARPAGAKPWGKKAA